MSSSEASQGLFPVILGHEGGGVVSQNTCHFTYCSIVLRGSLGRIGR